MNVVSVQKMAVRPSPPASLKQGYDSVSGAGRSTAIVGDFEETGGTSTLQCTVCTSITELTEALEIDQSLSISYGPIGSLSEKLTFVRNLAVTTTSISIVVYTKHLARIETLNNYQPDPNVTTPTDPASVATFFAGYGDSFLSSRTLGGEYYAVYTFYANDSQEQTSVKATLEADGIFSGVGVDATFQANFDSAIKKTTTRTDFAQNVSGIENPTLPSPENIVDYATKFTSLPLDMQAVIDFSVTGYENVPGLTAMKALRANRAYFIGDQNSDGLAGKLADLVMLRNKISDLIATYHVYGGYADTLLTARQTQVNADIAAVDQQIEQWEDDPTQSFTPLSPLSLTYGSPSISISTSTFGPHGGGGGDPYNDIQPDAVSFVSSRTHLTAIALRGDRYVDHLAATYQRGTTTLTNVHGGWGGDDHGTLTVTASGPVTTLNGRGDRYVDQLTISAGSNTIATGGDGGGPFSYTIPAGNFLLGFSGRSASLLDQVAFVYGGFQPAVWG